MKKMRLILVIILIMFLSYISPFIASPFKEYLLGPETVLETGKTDFSNTTLKCGDYVSFGSYYNKPIIWKIVDIDLQGKALLISEAIICFKAFDVPKEKDSFHYDDVKQYGSNQWDTSTLKEWLNSTENILDFYDNEPGFLCDNNFNAVQKSLISKDGVFIPDKTMLQEVYANHELKKKCTNVAALTNNSEFIITPLQYVWYWTSTPMNSNNVGVVTVTSSGTFYKTLAFDSTTGVCPALYLKTNTVETSCGNGSISVPYMIGG